MAMTDQWLVLLSDPTMVDELRKMPDEVASLRHGLAEVQRPVRLSSSFYWNTDFSRRELPLGTLLDMFTFKIPCTRISCARSWLMNSETSSRVLGTRYGQVLKAKSGFLEVCILRVIAQ